MLRLTRRDLRKADTVPFEKELNNIFKKKAYLYLDLQNNEFVASSKKLKNFFRYKDIGIWEIGVSKNVYQIFNAYNRSGVCVCKTTAKKMDGSQKVLNISYVGSSQNPHYRKAGEVTWYDKDVMYYHSKKMKERAFMQKVEKDFNKDVAEAEDKMLDDY